jgi:Mrp family chromosome partitioning ATPase
MTPSPIPTEASPDEAAPSPVAGNVHAANNGEAVNNGEAANNGQVASAAPAASAAQPASGAHDAPFNHLAFQLHHDMPRADGPRTVLLTTANTAPEAAQAGFALAHSLASELQGSVLCVDVDMMLGEASRVLGCGAARGFSDLMADPALRVRDLALPTSNPLVTFLPAGVTSAASQPRTLERVERAVKSLAEGYDFVLMIGGSVLDDTMALSIAPHVGSVVLFALENCTMLADLDRAQRALRICKARHIALVFGAGSR